MILGTHYTDELISPGRRRRTIHAHPIAYLAAGEYHPILPDWSDGDANWPHVVSAAPILTYTAGDGMRRMCPTREPDRYLELGPPYICQGATGSA